MPDRDVTLGDHEERVGLLSLPHQHIARPESDGLEQQCQAVEVSAETVGEKRQRREFIGPLGDQFGHG